MNNLACELGCISWLSILLLKHRIMLLLSLLCYFYFCYYFKKHSHCSISFNISQILYSFATCIFISIVQLTAPFTWLLLLLSSLLFRFFPLIITLLLCGSLFLFIVFLLLQYSREVFNVSSFVVNFMLK